MIPLMPGDPSLCSCALVRDSPGPWGLPGWWAGLAGELFDDVFICAPEVFPTALAAISPLVPDGSALGAVHAALVLARISRVVVLPGILPGPDVLRALAGDPTDADVVLFRQNDETEPALLPARFHRRCLKPIERALARGEDGLPAGLRVRRLEG